jgi:hypothetical protein
MEQRSLSGIPAKIGRPPKYTTQGFLPVYRAGRLSIFEPVSLTELVELYFFISSTLYWLYAN